MLNGMYARLFTGPDGESHFDAVKVDLVETDFAPPAGPLLAATLFPATACGFVCGPPNWNGMIPHPSPRRQVFCTVAGEYEVTASDGESQRFPAGSVLLLEDTSGNGHVTRITSTDPALVLTVTLADETIRD